MTSSNILLHHYRSALVLGLQCYNCCIFCYCPEDPEALFIFFSLFFIYYSHWIDFTILFPCSIIRSSLISGFLLRISSNVFYFRCHFQFFNFHFVLFHKFYFLRFPICIYIRRICNLLVNYLMILLLNACEIMLTFIHLVDVSWLLFLI